MSMTDPIADLLTRIRNAIRVHGATVEMPASRLKDGIVEVLTREGFIEDVREVGHGQRPRRARACASSTTPTASPSSARSARVSKPGRRVYRGVAGHARASCNGMGIAVLSTRSGVLSDREARAAGVGGEVLCEVW